MADFPIDPDICDGVELASILNRLDRDRIVPIEAEQIVQNNRLDAIEAGGVGGTPPDLSAYATIAFVDASQAVQDARIVELENRPLGEKGDKGDQGEQGIQGIQGEKGDTGASGADGAKGDQGEQGIQGIQGEKGADGTGIAIQGQLPDPSDLPPSGNTIGDAYLINGDIWIWDGTQWVNGGQIKGEKGDQGIQGIQGEAGADGAKGETGADGAKGDQGIQGEKGDKGDQGEKGADGTGIAIQGQLPDPADLPPSDNTIGDAYLINGDIWIWDGTQWVNGGQIKGEKGDQGIQGIQGEAGAKGADGAKGDQGIQGEAGAKGDQGEKGDQGIQGEKGADGANGADGTPADMSRVEALEIRCTTLEAQIADILSQLAGKASLGADVAFNSITAVEDITAFYGTK